jgi:hypothetical protein
MRNVLVQMDIRRQKQAAERSKDPRVTLTRIIFMHSEQTMEEAVAELVTDLVPRMIAEDMVKGWADDKAYEQKRKNSNIW